MMGLSYIKSIEFIQYVHLMMILRLICSNCLFRDDFDYVSFSSRLQIFKLIMRFCMIVLNIIAQEVIFLADTSNKVAWAKHVLL